MKCQKCGFENLEQSTYCSGCGQLLEVVETSKVASQIFEKKNRLILFSIIGVLVLALIGGGVWLAVKPSSVELAQSAYQANDLVAYQKVQKRMTSKQESEFESYLVDEATAIFESFKSEGLYYKEAIRKLERIKLYLTQTSPVLEIQNQVEVINTSRESYEQGKVWIDAREWENARECFEAVDELDPNYESAKRYLESILRWQLQEIGAEATAHFEAGEYEKALESIEAGLLLAPDHEILLNLKQNIETLLSQPPVLEGFESDEESTTLGGKLNSMIESGLEALGEGIKSFFNGSLFGN